MKLEAITLRILWLASTVLGKEGEGGKEGRGEGGGGGRRRGGGKEGEGGEQ